MSGIGEAECAEFFVITGEESGTRVDPTADIDEAAIDVEAELGHGVGFVDVRRSEELGSEGSEGFLRGDEKAAVVFAAPGDIQQADENAFGADADRVVEIACYAFADEQGTKLSAGDRWKDGGDGLDRERFGRVRVESGEHGAPRRR
jgi:hypothetical protein